MAFDFSLATLPQLKAAYTSAANLARAIEEYNEGNPAPAVYRNRFTDAELQVLITAAKTGIDALDAAVNAGV